MESTGTNRSRTLLAAIAGLVVLFAAWLQLGAALTTIVENPVRADAGEYVAYAYNLREYGVYSRSLGTGKADSPAPPPDAGRPPGYPLMMAALMQPSPDPGFVRRVMLVQALLGVLNVVLTMLIARRVVGGRWALAAGLLCAISPHLVVAGNYLLTETLFTTTLLLALLCTIEAVVRGKPPGFVLAGAMFGVAALVRPTALLLPVALLIVAVLVARRRPPLVRGALLAVLATAAVVAPWTLRNASLPAHAPRSELLVNFIHHGSYPELMHEGRVESYGYPYAFDPDAGTDGASVGAALDAVARHFREEPAKYAWWYFVGKPLTFLQWDLTEQRDGGFFVYHTLQSPYFASAPYRYTAAAMRLLHWPLTAIALLACVWLVVVRRAASADAVIAWVLATTLAYAIAVHAVGAPFPRYAVPFKPVLYIVAVWGIAAAVRYASQRLRGSTAGGGSAGSGSAAIR